MKKKIHNLSFMGGLWMVQNSVNIEFLFKFYDFWGQKY